MHNYAIFFLFFFNQGSWSSEIEGKDSDMGMKLQRQQLSLWRGGLFEEQAANAAHGRSV